MPRIRTKEEAHGATPAATQKRLGVLLVVLAPALVLIGVAESFSTGKSLWHSLAFYCGVFLCLQWLMVLPHELGHFVVGRMLGFKQARVIVGAGPPLISKQVFGVPLHIGALPLGGITLFGSGSERRLANAAVIFAGPCVNLTLASLAWIMLPPGDVFTLEGSGTRVFFWANLVISIECLFPCVVQTSFGPLQNDGLQLWRLMFPTKTLSDPRPIRVPMWEVALCYVLKSSAVLATSIATIFFGVVMVLPYPPTATLRLEIALRGGMLALAGVAAWLTYRLARNPIARFRRPSIPTIGTASFRWSAGQNLIAQKMTAAASQQEFQSAEIGADELIATIEDSGSPEYTCALQWKVCCAILAGDIGRAETVCLASLESPIANEQKQAVLDCFVCQLVYQLEPPHLGVAERLARIACGLGESATLKGTLGSVLAEQGNFAEAESLLRECYDTCDRIHDKGTASFYLGLVKLRTGKPDEARRLVHRGAILYPAPWLLAKAEHWGMPHSGAIDDYAS